MKETFRAKTEPIPWQSWIKSPAYLRLTPKKKIASLLHIIKRKEKEIAKLKDEFVIVKAQRDGFDSMHGELEERLGQIREWYEKRPREINVDDLNPFWDWLKSVAWAKQRKTRTKKERENYH